MDKTTSFTPFERELKALVDAPQPRPEFCDQLRQKLVSQPLPGPARRRFEWRWVVPAALTLALLVAFGIVGPQRVIAGVRHWLGSFIPGVGFVEERSDLRVLEGPVQVDAGELSLRVEKGYTNGEAMDLQFTYPHDRRTCKAPALSQEENRLKLAEAAYLLLPDGRKIPHNVYPGGRWLRFPALPADVNEATLVLPPDIHYGCTSSTPLPQGFSPVCLCTDEDLLWRIPLKFVVPPPGSALPVIDSLPATPQTWQGMASVTPEALPETVPSAQPAATATPAAARPELIGKLVALPDGGYLLAAMLQYELNTGANYRFGLDNRYASLVDASGAEIAIEEVDRSEVSEQALQGLEARDLVLFRTKTRPASGPLTLNFAYLVREVYSLGDETGFEISLPPNPKADQRFPQDRQFDFVPGWPFALKEVWVTRAEADGLGMVFTFAGQGIETIEVQSAPADMNFMGGSSGTCEDFDGCFYNETRLPGVAGGVYRLRVNGIAYLTPGPWSLRFEPE